MAEYAVYPQEIFQLKGRAYELQLIRWEMQLWKALHILGAEYPCAAREKKNHHWEYLGITADFIRIWKI